MQKSFRQFFGVPISGRLSQQEPGSLGRKSDIGLPFVLENIVTTRVISAKARDTGHYLPLIHTDFAVNPDNSDGPLISLCC
jgi:hypothetical protein